MLNDTDARGNFVGATIHMPEMDTLSQAARPQKQSKKMFTSSSRESHSLHTSGTMPSLKRGLKLMRDYDSDDREEEKDFEYDDIEEDEEDEEGKNGQILQLLLQMKMRKDAEESSTSRRNREICQRAIDSFSEEAQRLADNFQKSKSSKQNEAKRRLRILQDSHRQICDGASAAQDRRLNIIERYKATQSLMKFVGFYWTKFTNQPKTNSIQQKRADILEKIKCIHDNVSLATEALAEANENEVTDARVCFLISIYVHCVVNVACF